MIAFRITELMMDDDDEAYFGGDESQSIIKTILDDDDDALQVKYEQPFVKRMLLPQEPRLFCLLYNGNTVVYDANDELASQSMVSPSAVEDGGQLNGPVAI